MIIRNISSIYQLLHGIFSKNRFIITSPSIQSRNYKVESWLVGWVRIPYLLDCLTILVCLLCMLSLTTVATQRPRLRRTKIVTGMQKQIICLDSLSCTVRALRHHSNKYWQHNTSMKQVECPMFGLKSETSGKKISKTIIVVVKAKAVPVKYCEL